MDIQFIKDMGFDFYQIPGATSWGYVTDGTRIAYVQVDRYGSWDVSSVHKPNKVSGTGYQILRQQPQPTKRDIELAMNTFVPHWHQHDEPPKKFADWAEFHNFDSWNRKFEKV